MIRKIIPVFTAAAISMSISFVVPVAITAVSSFTFVSEAQAFGFKSIKKSVKKAARKTTSGLQKVDKRIRKAGKSTKDFVTAKNCPGGTWVNGYHGLCGKAVHPNKLLIGRIGDPVRGSNIHDHRKKPPSGVAISYNPLRWR